MQPTARQTNAASDGELDDYRWLVSGDAADLLLQAADWHAPTAAQVAALRKECSGPRAHLVLDQVALRARAHAKFAAADRMFFTALLLEQATDEWVAGYKAKQFAGRGAVLDLCCGIGGDLLALASLFSATGVDRDGIAALMATANLSAAGVAETLCRVRVTDVREVDVSDYAAWHIDPDRRPKGHRTTHVDLHEPGSDVIDALLARNANAAIKLAPAARMPETWREQGRLEWISRKGQCRQLVAWFGELASTPGARQATILADGAVVRTISSNEQCDAPIADRIGRFIFEPDAAVLAAKMGALLGAQHGLTQVAAQVDYWTGDQPIDDPALACFEVLEILPLRVKQLKGLVRQRQIGRLEIKKRGVEHDPEQLRRQLDPSGDNEATLLLTRIAGRATAILARRWVAGVER
jgi:hypothetical protein